MERWNPSKDKYGVAIWNYDGKAPHTLRVSLGETVHILEKYGTGQNAWNRGTTMKNKETMGIFPACIIHLLPFDVQNEGLYETVSPGGDIMIGEVSYVLWEWQAKCKQLYLRQDPLLNKIMENIDELIQLRAQLICKKLCVMEAADLKKDMVSVIDWGNGKLGLDLVPRIDGEQVDADKCSICKLYRVHENSAEIAQDDKPKRHTRRTNKSSKGELAAEAGLITHHLLVGLKSFGCNVGDASETFLSLYQFKVNKLVCLTEKFIVCHTKNGMPEDVDKLNNCYGLFTDLTTDDLDREIFLVANIYRLGCMRPEHSKKLPKLPFKRPWGVGVTSFNVARLPGNFKEYEFQIKVQSIMTSAEKENSFSHYHVELIDKINQGLGATVQSANSNKLGLTIAITLQVMHGDLASIRKENPMLFSKGVAQVQKIGISDVITPGEVRNDFYVTLKSADLERGTKTSGKNVEVRVTVLNEAGKPIEKCIVSGCGEPASSQYLSSIYYHNNHPEWNETLRISIPIDIFQGSHVCFELFHCSVSRGKEKREPYAFAYMKVTNMCQIVIKDDVHTLCLHSMDEKSQQNLSQYFKLPFLLDDLNDPQLAVSMPSKLRFKGGERESLTVSTLLCSGKFTQNGDLPSILNWRGDQFKGKLGENLDKLCLIPGEEIVKFLHDILDALFDMLVDTAAMKSFSDKIFKALIHIFSLIHHVRFETFKPVLESYITDTFSATLVHKPLCDCFGEQMNLACANDHKTNALLIQCFQVLDYIFRFIVQSRQLQQKDHYSQQTQGSSMAHEFEEKMSWLFRAMGGLLSSRTDRLLAYQKNILGCLHLAYPPLLEVVREGQLAAMILSCLKGMPTVKDIPKDITQGKLELLQRTVETKLFTCDESRVILLPLCLAEIKACLQAKKQVKLAITLFSDVMDQTFRLKQNASIRDDVKTLVETMFDVVMETIMSMGNSMGSKTTPTTKPRKPITKRVCKSYTHSGYTMATETNLRRRQPEVRTPSRESDEQLSRTDSGMFDLEESPSHIEGQGGEISPNEDLSTDHVDGRLAALSLNLLEKTAKIFRSHSTKHPDKQPVQEIGSHSITIPGLNRAFVPLIACLTEMLRLMEDEHYEFLLHVYHRGASLRTFLVQIFEVFKVLVGPTVFPPDWTVMRMVINNVVFISLEHFSSALKNNFLVRDKFDASLWLLYFNLAVLFITQPSLQLDRYSDVKAQQIRDRYQDMRVLMGVQVETLWQSLGEHRAHFIPDMIGPFLELTLVPEEEVRKATLPIIGDMMECEQRTCGHFRKVEAALIERLDNFLTQKHLGDRKYRILFKRKLLERVHSEPNLQGNGSSFVISVTHLLERLLDYRQVVDGEENRDKRMHCTFNILNFYKDEINREEMYIRYVNKLHELHMVANNHVEAGLTLQLYAKVLTWGNATLSEEMRYKQERECDRKEMLYTQIINCFDKGKVWEYALPLCKDLANYYEKNLDYKKLGDILKQQASFYQKILEGVPGEDPAHPDSFFPRQNPSYFRVAYYGKSFPAFVRNKQFIYRGDECLKLPTIINHLTAEFPAAHILNNNKPQDESIKEGQQQFIQVCSVKPVHEERVEFQGKDVPLEIQNFYNGNEVDTFMFDMPYHRGTMDPENESKTLCIERTKMKTAYKFPGILRWYEVLEDRLEVEMLCPIRVAIDYLKLYNDELELLISRMQINHHFYFPQLEMKLQGAINAAVSGGTAKYYEAFFTKEFEKEHFDEVMYLDKLKVLLEDQVRILHRGMKIHERLVPKDLMPLHELMVLEFEKMRKNVREHCSSPSSSMASLPSLHLPSRPGTPGSSSGSGRSSTYSQDEECSGMIRPEDMPFNLNQSSRERTRRSYIPFPEEGLGSLPPPVPTRPHSMLIPGKPLCMQATGGQGLTNKKSCSDPAMRGEVLPPVPVRRTDHRASVIPQRTESSRSYRPIPELPTKRRPSDYEYENALEDHEKDLPQGLVSPTSPNISSTFQGDSSLGPGIVEERDTDFHLELPPKQHLRRADPDISSHQMNGAAASGGGAPAGSSPGNVPPLPPRASPRASMVHPQSRKPTPNTHRPQRASTVCCHAQSSPNLTSSSSSSTDSLNGPPPIPRRSESSNNSASSPTSAPVTPTTAQRPNLPAKPSIPNKPSPRNMPSPRTPNTSAQQFTYHEYDEAPSTDL